MGRPRKAVGDKREHVTGIRLREDELDRIKVAAEAEGLTPSAWIRRHALLALQESEKKRQDVT